MFDLGRLSIKFYQSLRLEDFECKKRHCQSLCIHRLTVERYEKLLNGAMPSNWLGAVVRHAQAKASTIDSLGCCEHFSLLLSRNYVIVNYLGLVDSQN